MNNAAAQITDPAERCVKKSVDGPKSVNPPAISPDTKQTNKFV